VSRLPICAKLVAPSRLGGQEAGYLTVNAGLPRPILKDVFQSSILLQVRDVRFKKMAIDKQA
jgi:hypothetical protein